VHPTAASCVKPLTIDTRSMPAFDCYPIHITLLIDDSWPVWESYRVRIGGPVRPWANTFPLIDEGAGLRLIPSVRQRHTFSRIAK